jgi:hypothetical protein
MSKTNPRFYLIVKKFTIIYFLCLCEACAAVTTTGDASAVATATTATGSGGGSAATNATITGGFATLFFLFFPIANN